jgi:site-specific recombinase XerD
MAKRIPAIEARPRGPFRVVLQNHVGEGLEYWTVRDRDLAPVPVVEEWLREERQTEGKSVKTTRAYANDIKLFLTWCEDDGRSMLGGLEKLGYFKAYLRVSPIRSDQANRGLPRVATSRGRILAACRSFASFSIDRGYAGKELEGLVWRPAHGGQATNHYRQGRQARATEPINKFSPPKAATPDEYEAVLAASLSTRDSLMVMIMALMGLRVGELCGLRWSDCHVLMTRKQMVELSADTGVACDGRGGPHVHVVDRRESAMAATAATAKGPDCGPVTHRRVVPATPAVVEMFSLYAREAAAGKAQLADHVFTTAAGTMSTKAVAQQLQCIGQRAGLKRNRSPHSYRHLFGMTLGAAGVDLAHIAELMGHASTESTRIYTRLTPKQRRDAIDKAGIFDDISWFKPTTDEE